VTTMTNGIDLAKKGSDKTFYAASFGGRVMVEVPKLMYELMKKEEEKYLKALNSLPEYTKLFESDNG